MCHLVVVLFVFSSADYHCSNTATKLLRCGHQPLIMWHPVEESQSAAGGLDVSKHIQFFSPYCASMEAHVESLLNLRTPGRKQTLLSTQILSYHRDHTTKKAFLRYVTMIKHTHGGVGT